MAEPIIQTKDLTRTFQALRNRDPSKFERIERSENSPDFRKVPSSNYSPITSANTGSWGNGMARFASSSGIIYGQPQFFSPVHTPINWQIPSKRIEIMQWSFLSDDMITIFDGTSRKIKDIKVGDKVVTHSGEISNVDKILTREVNTNVYKVTVTGWFDPFQITEGHKIYIIPREQIVCKYCKRGKNGETRDSICLSSRPIYYCKFTGCKEYKEHYSPVLMAIEDVRVGDFIYTPIPKFKACKTISIPEARLLGYYCAEGCAIKKGVNFTFNINELEYIKEVKDLIYNLYGKETHDAIDEKNHLIQIRVGSEELLNFCVEHCGEKASTKKLSSILMSSGNEVALHFLGTYFNGDGGQCVSDGWIVFSTASFDLANQITILLAKCGIPSRTIKNINNGSPLIQKHSKKTSFTIYRIVVSKSETNKLLQYADITANETWGRGTLISVNDNKIIRKVTCIEKSAYNGTVYDIRVPGDFSVVCNMVAMANCRFFYQNEPKVAAAIDFYSQFPMSNWEHECKNRKVKLYFDRLKEKLNLQKWCRLISHEVHLLGDCFPFLEISCPICNGSGRIGSDVCEHDGGTIKRIIILNPDFVEVLTSPLNPDPIIALRPDEELINMVQRKTPGYEKLSTEVRKLIVSGQPIRLDNRSVYHLKYGESGYDKYGTGMVKRLFPILSYKTKLMVAQWIVAERLIVPIKIVKVGSDERPAGPADIAAVQAQLAQTANDPNLTIVTHHAFELDFVGACHDNQTEVLTENGWKLFKDATIEDEIGTYNLDSGKLEYQKPIEKQEYDYNGKMFNFVGKHIDVCVTPNHMMLVSQAKYDKEKKNRHSEWAKIRADIVKNGDRFINQVSWDGKIPVELPYKNTMLGHLDLDTYLEFIGYYLSEGGIKVSEGSPDAIHLTQKVNSEYYERMKQLMFLVKDSAKISTHIDSKSKDGLPIAQIIINSRKLAKEMMSIYGHKSFRKFIPRWILNLPCEKLRILFEAMINGDGNRRTSKNGKLRLKYSTVSSQMAEDIYEMGLKLGYITYIKKSDRPEYMGYNTHDIYRIYFTNGNKEKYKNINKSNIKQIDYKGKVYCFTVPNGYIVTRRNNKIGIHGNSGKVLTLSNEFELINQEILDGMMINNSLLNGEGPTFSAAAVGIEAMIQRLKTFREQVTEWLRHCIYIPEARRQAAAGNEEFVNKDDDGEDEVIVPKIKWENMHLRDQQQYRTFIVQLYEKGVVSAQTLLESFDLDPDQEIERKRYDALQMAALGQGAPGQGGEGGMGGGMGGMGGGMGGLPAPGGESPISAPGGDMGGMGTPVGAPPSPTGGGPTVAKSTSLTAISADPSQFGGRVLKKRTRERIMSDQQKQQRVMYQQQKRVTDAANGGSGGTQRDEKGRIIFTKAERDLLKPLLQARKQGLFGRHGFVPQFRVSSGDEEYALDFAFPDLKIGVEADGEIFHSAPKQITHDKERDMLLSHQGWTILRFTDAEIEKNPQQCIQNIIRTVMQKQLQVENLQRDKDQGK